MSDLYIRQLSRQVRGDGLYSMSSTQTTHVAVHRRRHCYRLLWSVIVIRVVYESGAAGGRVWLGKVGFRNDLVGAK